MRVIKYPPESITVISQIICIIIFMKQDVFDIISYCSVLHTSHAEETRQFSFKKLHLWKGYNATELIQEFSDKGFRDVILKTNTLISGHLESNRINQIKSSICKALLKWSSQRRLLTVGLHKEPGPKAWFELFSTNVSVNEMRWQHISSMRCNHIKTCRPSTWHNHVLVDKKQVLVSLAVIRMSRLLVNNYFYVSSLLSSKHSLLPFKST